MSIDPHERNRLLIYKQISRLLTLFVTWNSVTPLRKRQDEAIREFVFASKGRAHSGRTQKSPNRERLGLRVWWARRDLNSGPKDYEFLWYA